MIARYRRMISALLKKCNDPQTLDLIYKLLTNH
jgi:hypothetical protein